MQDIKKQINFWKNSAEKDFNAAKSLFKNKHYNLCLFICHLTLEKLLKGLTIKHKKSVVPPIHDLSKLAKLTGLSLDNNQVKHLKTITTFNIAGRYEQEKYKFYKMATKNYAKQYLEITKELFLWLKKEYSKK